MSNNDDLTRRQQEIKERMRSLLAKDGYVIQDVLGMPPYSYTVGRWENQHQPEIVMIGLRTEDMHIMIRHVVERVRAGELRVELDREIAGVVETPVRFRLVSQEIVRQHLLAIKSLTESGEAIVWQLVVPDRAGRFPGEEGVDARYEQMQDLARLEEALGE